MSLEFYEIIPYKPWMLNLGTFRKCNLTFSIFFLILIFLIALVIFCSIPVYVQGEKEKSKKKKISGSSPTLV